MLDILATITELRRLFSSYWLPDQVVSDMDCSWGCVRRVQKFLKSNGVKHIRCFPYHPSSNAAVKCFVQTLKKAMLAQNTKLSNAANFMICHELFLKALRDTSMMNVFVYNH